MRDRDIFNKNSNNITCATTVYLRWKIPVACHKFFSSSIQDGINSVTFHAHVHLIVCEMTILDVFIFTSTRVWMFDILQSIDRHPSFSHSCRNTTTWSRPFHKSTTLLSLRDSSENDQPVSSYSLLFHSLLTTLLVNIDAVFQCCPLIWSLKCCCQLFAIF